MSDETYMRRCLQLAALGLGKTSPNPMVGAVVVHEGMVIGEGYHHRCGESHAEINAINSVKDKALLNESTLYVNLEPCSHFGKTPPCADAIIRHGIPKVVIGSIDYHDKVNGAGVRKLRAAGVEVVENVCREECEELNKRFFTFHRKHRPYIILKWAQTLDGFMDIDRSTGDATSYWITNPALKVLSHKWRGEEDAILVGFRTMQNDRPQLTTREYPGKDPQRFVMQRGEDIISTLPYTPLPDNAQEAVEKMYKLNIQSVIVEGGKNTLEKFMEVGLWDEVRVLVGNQTWGSGLPAPKMPGIPQKTVIIDDNQLIYVRRQL
ncbi:MAG: bifunctional diaminohydroxyphosphoribosylaminopyrimidine deaminase/5-amino-6-(5-phosphoribosylamino)uracil reductase RibD [Bacteroidales bacterium]|nr:bifunctional diaminohydroxyphosphoribosylaminopyrimidine deaminase/5-amino-6-(5-phosphoribosylamino)uracil reductase RibD [Bacteroidales bacterium]